MTADAATHLHSEALVDYFAERLPDEQQQSIEEHLAVCHACTTRARAVRLLSETLDWTAPAHAALYRREAIARALEIAEGQSSELRQRLQSWRERFAGLAEAGLRIVVESSATAARVLAEGVETLSRPASPWHFAPVPQSVRARGDSAPAESSALLATRLDAAAPQARVAVRGGEASEVEIRIDGLSPDAPSPLVILVRVDAPGMPSVRVAEPEDRPGAGYRIARFAGLPPGEYLVAFEPMAGDAA